MPALIVFAKYPQPGHVKTRLTPFLTPTEAASLYTAFLHDALAQYTALSVPVRLYLAGTPPSTRFLQPHEAGVTLHQQHGPDLGARMWRAFVETFGDGYRQAVVIGTDHPTLPSAFIAQAFSALDTPQSVCLGPSEDGGYYLLGMNDLYASLFQDMVYSQPDVFEETLWRAHDTQAHLTILPPWYDVDTPTELMRLLGDLHETEAPLQATRAWVEAAVPPLATRPRPSPA
ncbi:MAG: TIGR04282 family arsenosugar biosynthesis glycosyltransferase [Bacteroidota bacterium]